MKPSLRGRGLSIELAITIFGVMLSYWTGKFAFHKHDVLPAAFKNAYAASDVHDTDGDTITDYGMSYVDSEAQFRFPIAFQIFFAVLAAVMVFLLPESPRWVSDNIQ
jgi:Sugar (and other) transporter